MFTELYTKIKKNYLKTTNMFLYSGKGTNYMKKHELKFLFT